MCVAIETPADWLVAISYLLSLDKIVEQYIDLLFTYYYCIVYIDDGVKDIRPPS